MLRRISPPAWISPHLSRLVVRRALFCLWLLATVVSGQVDITDAEEGLGLAGALLRSQTPSPGNSQSSSSDMPTWQELHKIWLNSRRLSPLLLNETSFQLKSFPTGVAAGEDSEVLLQSTFNPIPAAQLRTSNIRFQRYPQWFLPPPDLPSWCPSTQSVRQYGAQGNGAHDDSGSIRAANGALSQLYFPPGTYLIAQNLDITKPFYAGMGAVFQVAAGKRLTIGAQFQRWDHERPLFVGPGRVVLHGSVSKINPDWFGGGEANNEGLQKASNACAGRCTVMVTRAPWMRRAWTLHPKVGVFSTQDLLAAAGGQGRGVVLREGSYKRPLLFGSLREFGKFAIKVKGGVRDAEIQLHSFAGGNDGIVFAPQEGRKREIVNVRLSHFAQSVWTQNTVVIEGTRQEQMLDKCYVSGNFVQLGGGKQWGRQSAAALVRGPVAPRIRRTAIVFQAWDPLQDVYRSRHIALQSTARTPTSGLNFVIEGWAGGFSRDGKFGKLVDGKFRKLQASFRMAHEVFSPQNQLGDLQGSNNRLFLGSMSSPGVQTEFRSRNENGGVLQSTISFFSAPVQGAWLPNQVRTFFVDSIYAPLAGVRMRCLSRLAGSQLNDGITCAGYRNLSAPGRRFRIAVQLRNSSGRRLTAAQFPGGVRLGLQVGP